MLLGEQFASFIDPVDEPALVRAVEELGLGTRNYIECEMRCQDAQGAELWLRAHLHAVYGADGRPEYLVSQIFSLVGRHIAPAARGVPAVEPATVVEPPAEPPPGPRSKRCRRSCGSGPTSMAPGPRRRPPAWPSSWT